MKYFFIAVLLMTSSFSSLAIGADFNGTWSIDLRTAEEKKSNVECGVATFSLAQKGENIIGSHEFYTPYCSRLNEGGSVVGTAKGSTAILFVTSGRNGAIVKGKASLKNDALHWVVLDELKPGDIEGDSPLILYKGVLTRENPKPAE